MSKGKLSLFPVTKILCSIILITVVAKKDKGSFRRVSETNGGSLLEARYRFESVNLLFSLCFFSMLSFVYTFHFPPELALNFDRDLIRSFPLESLQRLMKILLSCSIYLPTSYQREWNYNFLFHNGQEIIFLW